MADDEVLETLAFDLTGDTAALRQAANDIVTKFDAMQSGALRAGQAIQTVAAAAASVHQQAGQNISVQFDSSQAQKDAMTFALNNRAMRIQNEQETLRAMAQMQAAAEAEAEQAALDKAMDEANKREEIERQKQQRIDAVATKQAAIRAERQEQIALRQAQQEFAIAVRESEQRSEARRNAMEQDIRLQNELENARITATKTGYERELELLRAKNRQEREERRRNGLDTSVTDQIAAYREQALMQNMAGAGGGGGGRGLGHAMEGGGINNYFARRLGYHLGMTVGMSGVGNIASLGAFSMEEFGASLGLLTTVVAVAGMTFQELHQKALDFANSLVESSSKISAAAEKWRHANDKLLPQTPAGAEAATEMQSAAEERAQAIGVMNKAMMGAQTLMGKGDFYADSMLQFIQHPLKGMGYANSQTTLYKTMRDQLSAQQYAGEKYNIAKDAYDYTYGVAQRRAAENREASETGAYIASLPESPQKERQQLVFQQGEEQTKLQRDYEDKKEQMREHNQIEIVNLEQAQRMATETLKNAPAGMRDEARKQLNQAQADLNAAPKRQLRERRDLESDHAANLLAMEGKQQRERLGLDRKQVEDRLKLANEADAAQAAVGTAGFERQLAQMKVRNAFELEEAKKHGLDLTVVQRKQAAEEKTLIDDHQFQLDSSYRQMVDSRLAALHQMTTIDAQWAEKERQLRHDMGNLPGAGAEIERQKEAFYALQNALKNGQIADEIRKIKIEEQEASFAITPWQGKIEELAIELMQFGQSAADAWANAKRLVDEMKNLSDIKFGNTLQGFDIQTQLAQNRITQMQADLLNARLQHPEWTEGQRRAYAERQATARSAQFVHQQEASIDPRVAMADYARQLQEALRTHTISQAGAETLLRNKEAETYGRELERFNAHPGQFVRGQINLQALHLNNGPGAESPAHKTNRHLKSIDEKLAQIIKDGGGLY